MLQEQHKEARDSLARTYSRSEGAPYCKQCDISKDYHWLEKYLIYDVRDRMIDHYIRVERSYTE